MTGIENLNDSKKSMEDLERDLRYAKKDRDIEVRRAELWSQPASYESRIVYSKKRQKRKSFLRRLDKGDRRENVSKNKEIRLEGDKEDVPKRSKSQSKKKNRRIVSKKK